MGILKYLGYLAMAGMIVEAIQAAKTGEAVIVPPIKGVRVGNKSRSYTLNIVATPE